MRVLYVATDLRDADILHQEVRRVAPGLSMEICAGLSELRARPDQSPAPDVLLMDCSLSEAEQLQLIHYARVRQLGVPVVGVMGASGQMPSAALTAGLDDLLVRGPKFAERLQPALRLSTERFRTVNQTQRENEKLKRSEARLRLIIEALPTGVVLLEQGGRVLAMNAAGVQLFGSVSPQEIVGRAFQTLLPVEDQPAFQDFLKKTSSGEEASFQFQSQAHEGDTPHVFSLRGLCIQRDDSGQTAVLGVLDRVQAGGSNAHHAWTPDFNLDSAGLTPPLLDMGPPGIDPAVLAEAEKRAGDLEARAHKADARVAELDAEIAKLRAAHDAAETRAAAMQQQLAQAQEQHAQVSVELGNTRHEMNNVRQELLYEQERRVAAEAQAQSHAASAANAAAEDLAKHTEALATLAGELETARGEVASLMDSVARERHEKESAQASLALVESEMQGQSGHADAIRAELTAVGDELAKARAAAEALQAANQQLQAAALEQQAQQGQQHEHLHALQQSMQQTHHAELEAIRGELASTAAALAAQREAHDQQREAYDQLQASIARKDAQVADLEQRAASRIIALEKEHRVAVDRLQELLDQAVKDSQANTSNTSRGADAARRGAERVGRLAAAMAADLNAAAESAAEAARAVINAVPQGAHGHDHAAKTLETVSRCTELSRHLLRMSTRYMGQQTRTDVSHLVRQQEALLQHLAGPDIELQFELAPGLMSVDLDAQDLTQVLTSLTVTARDALPLGGAIKITTTAQRHDAEAGQRGDHPRPLVLAVTARGYGIRPVSSATCEDVTARCGGLLTTVIEPNVSWTLMAMLPGLSSDLESLTRSA